MDTTEKYIKWCKKAEEVQKEWRIQKGDWSHHPYRNETELILTSILINVCHCKSCIRIWLPRQDQLQEMIITSPDNCWFKLDSFETWKAKKIWPTSKSIPQSMEQLWLAFVMHEKYSKKWDDSAECWEEEK